MKMISLTVENKLLVTPVYGSPKVAILMTGEQVCPSQKELSG